MPNIVSKYAVPGLEYRLEKLGTDNKPFLVAITAGQQNGKTLIFHFKIGERYYEHFASILPEKLEVSEKSMTFLNRSESDPARPKMNKGLYLTFNITVHHCQNKYISFSVITDFLIPKMCSQINM